MIDVKVYLDTWGFDGKTANGVDTSPIIRGVWVYETYGKHAPLPPDSVPAIEPDIRNERQFAIN